jgi:hypothetical protein
MICGKSCGRRKSNFEKHLQSKAHKEKKKLNDSLPILHPNRVYQPETHDEHETLMGHLMKLEAYANHQEACIKAQGEQIRALERVVKESETRIADQDSRMTELKNRMDELMDQPMKRMKP